MCNHYRNDAEWRRQAGEFSHLRIPLFDAGRPRPNSQTHLYPGRVGEILLVEGAASVAVAAQWRLIPRWFRGSVKEFGAKWRGCNNVRSEGVANSRMFKDSLANRCLIPAAAIFEYGAHAGPDGKKIEFEFEPVDGEPLWIGGLYERSTPSDGPVTTYAMVMTAGGPDALSIGHERSPIFLQPQQRADWLNPANDIDQFAKPPPGGLFHVRPSLRSTGL